MRFKARPEGFCEHSRKGGAGYIGSIVVEQLVNQRHHPMKILPYR